MQPIIITPSDFGYYQFYSHSVSIQQSDSDVKPSSFDIISLIFCLGFVSFIIWCKKRRFNHCAIEKQRKQLERIWELSSTK